MWDVQHLKVLSILKCEGAKMVVWPSYNSMKIMVGMMLVVLVGMHQVSKMLQDVGPPKTVDSISHHSNDTVRRLEEQHKDDDNGGEYTHGKTRVVSHGVLIEDMKQRLDVVQVNTLQSKQEMEQMRTRVMELEQDLHMFKHHLSESVEFRPLKSPEFSKHLEQGEERFDGHTHHYFMSEFKGRGMKQGPPEFFCFPSSPSSSSSSSSSSVLAAAAALSSSPGAVSVSVPPPPPPPPHPLLKSKNKPMNHRFFSYFVILPSR